MALPEVAVFSLGGTISSTDSGGKGVEPTLTGEALISGVPEISDVAEVSAASFRQAASGEITVEDLIELASKMPVVLASRTGGGEVLRSTYGFVGSETDLLERGLIYAGPLDGRKARLLVTLLLTSGTSKEKVKETFGNWLESQRPGYPELRV